MKTRVAGVARYHRDRFFSLYRECAGARRPKGIARHLTVRASQVVNGDYLPLAGLWRLPDYKR